MELRPARDGDIPAMLGFWNPLIRETTITFSNEEKTAEGLAQMIAGRRAAGREFLVAEEAGEVLGLASYDQFRGGNGYAHCMEHTVILSPAARGRGVGRALMAALEDHARTAGSHSMIAAVSAENEAGIAFHRAIGYVPVGLLPQAGRKFGRWLDLALLQKIL
ncbi:MULTISPECIES: GNAT family N-acetyltransferase [Paracoccus]|jgi:phosphinothricin acetyltransferase|uniref:GNAT family N-acetyltransferase n=1 Tax=Paracoccus TaxID=265 RepID=UPI000CEBC1B6|nr:MULTISPECIES: GNAT family N-acetyltransferase [Paracoccus]MDK8872788.1 N-acetyltransferase family protein [Paracoccus sp. SSJ]UFS67684.1 N-acetyltransferase family protein [Paracoccus denitrificans]